MALLSARRVWRMGTSLEQNGNRSVFLIHAGHFAAQQYRVPSLIFAIEVSIFMECLLGWERIGQ